MRGRTLVGMTTKLQRRGFLGALLGSAVAAPVIARAKPTPAPPTNVPPLPNLLEGRPNRERLVKAAREFLEEQRHNQLIFDNEAGPQVVNMPENVTAEEAAACMNEQLVGVKARVVDGVVQVRDISVPWDATAIEVS